MRLATSDVRRLGVVATTCAQCGSVALYVGSRRVGVISLRAGTTHHRQLLMLPALSAHGSVTVRVTTSALMVNLDGLVVRSV